MFPRIVICLNGESPQQMVDLIRRAELETKGPILEIRADYFSESDLNKHTLKLIREASERRLILTIRSVKEGGRIDLDIHVRNQLFLDAIALNFDYIDIEISSSKELITNVIKNKGRSLIILSSHNFHETDENDIEKLIVKMRNFNPDLMKITTTAQKYEDNKTIEKIVQKYRNCVPPLTCFSMGEKGKDSRIIGYTLGNVLTYLALDNEVSTASGQLTYSEFLMV